MVQESLCEQVLLERGVVAQNNQEIKEEDGRKKDEDEADVSTPLCTAVSCKQHLDTLL